MRRMALVFLVAVIGLVLWLVAEFVVADGEAWDTLFFPTVIVPLMMLTAGLTAYKSPARPYIFGIAVVILQPFALLAAGVGDTFNLGPIAVVAVIAEFGILVLVCVCASLVGAALRRRRAKREAV